MLAISSSLFLFLNSQKVFFKFISIHRIFLKQAPLLLERVLIGVRLF